MNKKGKPSAESSRSVRGLGKGVSGKPYPRMCNARGPRLEPGTFRSQAGEKNPQSHFCKTAMYNEGCSSVAIPVYSFSTLLFDGTLRNHCHFFWKFLVGYFYCQSFPHCKLQCHAFNKTFHPFSTNIK